MQMSNKNHIILFIPFIVLSFCWLFTTPAYADQGNVSVSATVPPKSADYQFSMTTDSQGTLRQNTIIPYTITYGASSSAGVAAQTTITANFNNDMAPDGTHVTDYVPGSATTAYSNTQPVIDEINRTITWTIPSLPPGVMNQTVTFSIKTNNNYTQPKTIDITVLADMSNQYATMPEQNIIVRYRYFTSPPGPQPTATIAPQQPTGTPMSPLQFTAISLTQILDTSATVHISTTTNAKLTLLYGTSPLVLQKQLRTAAFTTDNDITLTSLQPDTSYYFRVIATDPSGQQAGSEIYTFTTARTASENSFAHSLFSIISNNSVIYANALAGGLPTPLPVIILPPDTSYQLMVNLPVSGWIKSANVEVRNTLTGSSVTTPFTGLTSVVYTADLVTSGQTGNFELLGKTLDTQGNLKLTAIANLHVVPPFQVETTDNQPVADARVVLYVLNDTTGEYKPASDIFPWLQSPIYTDLTGKLSLVLPKGTYKAVISTFGYSGRTVTFTIDEKSQTPYPSVQLTARPFDIISLLMYVLESAFDFFIVLQKTVQAMVSTLRYFNLFAITTLTSSVLLSYLLLQLRTHIKLTHLPYFLLFHFYRFTRMGDRTNIYGSVMDQQEKPISQVRIEVREENSESVISHALTNKTGKFYFTIQFTKNLVLTLSKEGYPPIVHPIKRDAKIPEDGYIITMNPTAGHLLPGSAILATSVKELAGMFFELVLLISIIFEVLFLSIFGFAKTAPFFVLSFINLVSWLLFLREGKKK